MIKTVVFDIGNVLIDFDWDKYVHSLFDDETAGRVTHAMFGNRYWHELDKALLSEDEIIGLFCSVEPGYEAEIKEAFSRVGECVGRLGWAIPLIESIKDQGYQVLFLSNMSEHVIASNPAAFDFTDHMDGGIYSYQVHLIKPGATIFKKLFEKYDLNPWECLFIDDSPANVAKARGLGMKAIKYTDRDQLAATLEQALKKDKTHDKLSVMCYGDSNTYAYDPNTGGRYPYEKRWTTLLAKKLGDLYEVIPQGLNGRTTAYDRPGAAWKNGTFGYAACLGTNKPVDYVVLMLGTNDCLEELRLSAEDIAAGMEKLVQQTEELAPMMQGYVPQMVIVAPAAIKEAYENSPFGPCLSKASLRKSRDIAPLYADIAKKHGCLFVDASESAEVSHDCMHLTEKGHLQLSDLIFKVIKDEAPE